MATEKLPLTAFKAEYNDPQGVTVRIGPDKTLTLRHAFIRFVGVGGHKGVYLRGRHLPSRGPNAGKGKILPSGFVSRFVIKEQFGPPVSTIVAIPKILDGLVDDANRFMNKQLNSQLDRFLK